MYITQGGKCIEAHRLTLMATGVFKPSTFNAECKWQTPCSAEKQRTKLCVTQLGTFELCRLLSILRMHRINPIWLREKEIVSLNDAILELTNSVLSPHSLVVGSYAGYCPLGALGKFLQKHGRGGD